MTTISPRSKALLCILFAVLGAAWGCDDAESNTTEQPADTFVMDTNTATDTHTNTNTGTDTNAAIDTNETHTTDAEDDALDVLLDTNDDAEDANDTGHHNHDTGQADAGDTSDANDISDAADVVDDTDFGPIVENCVPGPQPSGLIRICVPFPSGVRVHEVPPIQDAFGTANPPAGTVFDDVYTPGPGECSVAAHDRYWVRGRDGRVYRTWHPPAGIEVGTGQPCNFGHEHGDDPRTSPLYFWAGGIAFGIANHAAAATGFHRHEDHYGHKVVVQNMWEAVVGNPPGPSEEPCTPAGFHCHWLSKVHQGTHSGDSLTNNMHEYQNNVMCDDGAARTPDAGRDHAGPDKHTENSVIALAHWGHPGEILGCDAREVMDLGPGQGTEPPAGSDTKREIPCARAGQGFFYKEFPVQTVSGTGHTDFMPRDAGLDEIWKPWMLVTTRDGADIFHSSAYYGIRNPSRIYNEGTLVPQRDMNGDGTVDNWIPTLEACLAIPQNDRFGQCRNLPTFPSNVPVTSWWKLPESPFNGTMRYIHPKGTSLYNGTGRSDFCTDAFGQETADDPNPNTNVYPKCPEGQIYQRVAPTWNLWFGAASWGPNAIRGAITGSAINALGPTTGSGIGHEWVRFFNAPGVHAPN